MPIRWKRADGARPGLSRAVLRYPLRRLLRPVLHRVVVGLADGDLLEAVPLNPAVLVGTPELRPDLRREAVEQVEDGRGVAAEEHPGEAEGLPAHVGEDAGGDALGRAAPLE